MRTFAKARVARRGQLIEVVESPRTLHDKPGDTVEVYRAEGGPSYVTLRSVFDRSQAGVVRFTFETCVTDGTVSPG